jgi:hypothetical protein
MVAGGTSSAAGLASWAAARVSMMAWIPLYPCGPSALSSSILRLSMSAQVRTLGQRRSSGVTTRKLRRNCVNWRSPDRLASPRDKARRSRSPGIIDWALGMRRGGKCLKRTDQGVHDFAAELTKDVEALVDPKRGDGAFGGVAQAVS